jgi:hypothetical protein
MIFSLFTGLVFRETHRVDGKYRVTTWALNFDLPDNALEQQAVTVMATVVSHYCVYLMTPVFY